MKLYCVGKSSGEIIYGKIFYRKTTIILPKLRKTDIFMNLKKLIFLLKNINSDHAQKHIRGILVEALKCKKKQK
jgi:hypothetical protein